MNIYFIINLFILILCLFFFANNKRVFILIIFCCISPISLLLYYLAPKVDILKIGKSWSILEIILLFLFILAIEFFKHLNNLHIIDIIVLVFILLSIGAFIIGNIRTDTVNLYNVTRGFLFLPVYYSAVLLMKNKKNIYLFLDSILISVIILFIFHLLIAFKLILLPIDENYLKLILDQGKISRIEWFLAPVFYLIGFSVAISNIFFHRRRIIISYLIFTISLIGIILTQTRSYYLGLISIILIAILFLRKKTIAFMSVLALSIFIIVSFFSILDIDIFFRFKGKYAPQDFRWQGYLYSLRGIEYFAIINKYSEEPFFILTGRGFGAPHEIGLITDPVSYVHNEYLKVFNYFGIIGLFSYIFLLTTVLKYFYHYKRHKFNHPFIFPIYLAFIPAIFTGQFASYFWNNQTGPILFCYLAIIRNTRKSYMNFNDLEVE